MPYPPSSPSLSLAPVAAHARGYCSLTFSLNTTFHYPSLFPLWIAFSLLTHWDLQLPVTHVRPLLSTSFHDQFPPEPNTNRLFYHTKTTQTIRKMPSQRPSGRSGLPRPPVTYSRRSATSRSAGAAGNGVDNEAKGEEAFDRISRGARGGGGNYQEALRRAAKLDYRSRHAGAQSKSAALTASSVQAEKSVEKPDRPRLSDTHSVNDEEDDDIAEAIARSLGKTVGDPDVTSPFPTTPKEHDDSNIAEAKVLSLLSAFEPATPTAEGHSYKSVGSGSASSATPPHAPLHALLHNIRRVARKLEEIDPEFLARSGPELASAMMAWQNKVVRVLYATGTAEYKRIQDIKGHLKHDQEVEEKHQEKMNAFSTQCGAQMLQMQQDHQGELQKQKDMYEAYISEHIAKPPTLPARPPVPPPFVFTAGGRGPPCQDQMSQSTRSDPGPSSDGGPGWARKRARRF
jgi:hypothetical protein